MATNMTDEEREKDENKVAGGVARAAALSEDRRTEIARNAAAARWTKDMPAAAHEGVINLG